MNTVVIDLAPEIAISPPGRSFGGEQPDAPMDHVEARSQALVCECMFMGPVRGAARSACACLSGPASDLHNSIEDMYPELDEQIGGLPNDQGFVAMLDGYRKTGGLARGNDLERWMENRQPQRVMALTKLIVSRQIFSFEWFDTFWIPMFQFVLPDLAIKPGLRKVLAELSTVFDGWTLAAWFVQSNPSLNGGRPVNLLDSNLSEVVQAARLERFIATG